MRKMIRTLAFVAIAAMLSACDALDDSSDPAPATPVTFNYAPLAYRVKLAYTATFTYTPRDRSDAADYVIAEFERKLEADGNNGSGYEIAQGVQPDLNVNITVNSDDSNNKTMHVQVSGASTNVPAGTSTDGKTYPYYVEFNTNASYRDVDAMIDDMADQLNGYVANGWWKTVNE